MTDLAHLPPLPPLASRGADQAGPTVFPSKHGEDLVAAITVLMAGLVALAWALRLDTSEGQVLVAAATSFTLLAPAVTCTILRSAIRHARLQ
jgi:hypothetical protein